MFGLEGAGFTIAIAVSLLLAGLVVFYCKQRMDSIDVKIAGMLKLNKALANSQASLEQRIMYSGGGGGGSGSSESEANMNLSHETSIDEDIGDNQQIETDGRMLVSDDDNNTESESESGSDSGSGSDEDSDTDSDSESDLTGGEIHVNEKHFIIGSEINNPVVDSGIKVVELNSAINDNEQEGVSQFANKNLEEIKLGYENNNENDDDEDDEDDDDEDDEDDDDEDDDEDSSVQDFEAVSEIEVEAEGDVEGEAEGEAEGDAEIEAVSEIEAASKREVEELILNSNSNEDFALNNSVDLVKMVVSADEETDITNLPVSSLRNLAVSKSLTDKAGAKKLKKAALIELLS